MSKDASLTFGQRIRDRFRAMFLALRRFFFHLFRRYRNEPIVTRRTIVDLDTNQRSADLAPPTFSADTRTAAGTSLNFPLRKRRQNAADLETVPTDPDDYRDLDRLALVKQNSQPLTLFPPRTPSSPRVSRKTALAAPLAASETKTVSAGWLSDWFGPVSPRRKMWLFVSTTGTIGIVLALILLLNRHEPQQDPEPVRIAATTTSTKVKQPEPQPDPFAEIDLATKTPEVKPEPKAPPVKDNFDLQVILLPAPDEENQGEQFSVTSQDSPAEGITEFDPVLAASWRKSRNVIEPTVSPWESIERLVPLGPLEPAETASRVTPSGSIQALFETTQPRKSAPYLPMSYEIVVSNEGPTSIDRLTLIQTLPTGLQPELVAPASSVTNRTLRWERDGLPAQRTWRIPMTVVPTQSGPVVPATTLEATATVSSRTVVLAPKVTMTLRTEPFAQLNEYQQVVFRITNNGDVPLNKLLMQVKLSDNLWHRFGNVFEFHELALAVGQTREALLHVRADAAGPAELLAHLITDEGATIQNHCQFLVDGDEPSTNVPATPYPNIKEQPAPVVEPAPVKVEPTKPEPTFAPLETPAKVIVPERQPLTNTPLPTETTPLKPEPARAIDFPLTPNESPAAPKQPAAPPEVNFPQKPTNPEPKPGDSTPIAPLEKLPVKEFPQLKKPGSSDDPFDIAPKKKDGNFFD